LHPNEWIKIAAIVDRSESDCRDRWRGELKGQESRVTGAWSAEETDALIAAVTEANKRLGLPPTAPETPWQVVVDLMGGTRSLTQCRKKWCVNSVKSMLTFQAGHDPPGPQGAGGARRRRAHHQDVRVAP